FSISAIVCLAISPSPKRMPNAPYRTAFTAKGKRVMSVARWIVTAAALAALCAPLMRALAALSGGGHRWVDILAQFTAPALMATLVLVAVLAVSRLWIAAGAGGVVALLLLIALWPQWAPDRGTPAPDAPVISLYSANLYIGNQNADAIA